MVREYQKTMGLNEAVQKAVVDCIDKDVLKDFLLKRKGEVVNMLTTEINAEPVTLTCRACRYAPGINGSADVSEYDGSDELDDGFDIDDWLDQVLHDPKFVKQKAELYRKLDEAEADRLAGRVRPHEEVFSETRRMEIKRQVEIKNGRI